MNPPIDELPLSLTERKKKRWSLFLAACFGFCICCFLLWKLVTDPRGERAAIVVGWLLVPLGLLFTTWLAVCCVRKKESDSFYDGWKPE
jgi:hypothetical protein